MNLANIESFHAVNTKPHVIPTFLTKEFTKHGACNQVKMVCRSSCVQQYYVLSILQNVSDRIVFSFIHCSQTNSVSGDLSQIVSLQVEERNCLYRITPSSCLWHPYPLYQ